jgi:hypothetical protein
MASPRDFSPFVPFDLYDFFGYLFPGVIFAASLLIFYGQLHTGSFVSWHTDLDMPFVMGLGVVIVAVVLLYSLGHFIATISYIIIDRVLVEGIEGYPVNHYLRLTKVSREYSEATFKYLFVLFNLLMLTPILPVSHSAMGFTAVVLMALILLLIIQRLIVMVVHQRAGGRELARRLGGMWQFRLFLIPDQWILSWIIQSVRKLFGMDRQFPQQFIDLYKVAFEKRFHGVSIDQASSENYWLSAFAASSADPMHDRTLHTWLHLYGFSRNASAALCLSSTLILLHLLLDKSAFTGLVPLQVGIQWFLAAVLGLRYWNLYSHYYTKGIVRAFVEISTRPWQ